MFVLASYPRSGNTFFRNVLYHVYGIPSKPYNPRRWHLGKADLAEYPVVKAHHLPHELPGFLRELPAVYLVRDFRDVVVSMAHKRRRKEGAAALGFTRCLVEIILAPKDTHFGGWSYNVACWQGVAKLVIRFEDLVENPIREVEKARLLMDLPIPDRERLPSFEFLKNGKGQYPVYESQEERKRKARQFFRKGKVGGWREEMPLPVYALLINFHGDILKESGYDLFPEGYGYFRFLKNISCKRILAFTFKALMDVGILR